MPSELDELLPAWQQAAEEIVARGLWCVVEVCTHWPTQQWEARLIACERDSGEIGNAITECISPWPQVDLRIAGYTRDSLRRARRAPTASCHVALTASDRLARGADTERLISNVTSQPAPRGA